MTSQWISMNCCLFSRIRSNCCWSGMVGEAWQGNIASESRGRRQKDLAESDSTRERQPAAQKWAWPFNNFMNGISNTPWYSFFFISIIIRITNIILIRQNFYITPKFIKNSVFFFNLCQCLLKRLKFINYFTLICVGTV